MNKLGLRLLPNFNVEASVDGERLVNPDDYQIDVPLGLLPSVERDGYWYIVTCTCGDPYCGGISHGVDVRHGGDTTSWHLPEPAPMRDYVFNSSEYADAVNEIVRVGRRLAESQREPEHDACHPNVDFFYGRMDEAEARYTWNPVDSTLRPWRTKY